MASFDIQPPEINAPDWTRVSRPIQQPESDKSTGIALTTIGTGLEEGAKLADSWEKQYLKDKVETGVNKLRDDTTTVYQGIRNAQSGSLIPDQSQTLAQADQPAVPPSLQSGLDKAKALGASQAQNTGHVNDTFYTMNLNSLAKQLRAQYPGYKDYIDEQIKSVSGVDPANAYMKNLLEDINRNSTNQKSEQDKAITLGRQWLGYDPHVPAYIEAVRQGLPGAVQNLEQAVNTMASTKAKFDNWHMQHEYGTATKVDDALTAQDQYRSEVTAAAYRWQHGVVSIPGLTNPATISKLIADDQNGVNPLSDEQKGMLQQAMQQAKVGWQQEAINIQNGKGRYATRIQDQKTIDSITGGAGQWFDNQLANIGGDKTGAMFTNQRRMQSIQSDAEVQVATNNDLGAYAKATMVWNKFGGPNWVNTAQGQFLAKGGFGKFTNFLEDANRRSQVPDDLRKDGVVKSMYDDINKIRQYAADNNEAVPQKVYNNLVDNVNTIVDPKSPNHIKEEVVNYAFKPKNWNIMNQFGTDFTDDQGVQHKGKNSVFDTMTNSKVTDGIWNLHNNQSWGLYKNWAEQSFNRIYGGELKTLNTISEDQSLPVKVNWDSDNRRFGIEYGRKPQTDIEANYIKNSQAVVNRLNAGISNLARVQDHEGTDTSAYLIDSMIQQGFRPGTEVQGLPQKVYDAIKASHRSNRIEDAFKAGK